MSEQEIEVPEFTPMDLDDIYSDGEKPEEKVEPEVEPEKVETEEKTEDEVEKEAEPEVKEEKKEDHVVPLSVMLAERDQKKAALAENAELKAQLKPAEETKPTSVFDDEDGFRNEINTGVQNALYQERLANSQEDAIDKYGEEVVEAAMTRLGDLAKTDTNLAVRFQQSRRPFIEAVKIVQDYEKAEKMGDPDAFEADIRKQERQTVLDEIDALAAGEQAIDDSLPKSPLSTTSKGSLKTGETEFKPTALEDIYED